MTTIAAGNHQQIYFDHLDDIVITPGSGGTVKFDCSTPNSAATRPTARIIYSETVISIPAGSTVFLDAVGADATYDRYTYPSRSSLESAYPASSNAGKSAMAGPLGSYQSDGIGWRPVLQSFSGLRAESADFGDSITANGFTGAYNAGYASTGSMQWAGALAPTTNGPLVLPKYNHGVGGDTLLMMIARLPDVLARDVDIVNYLGGTNSISLSYQDFCDQQETIIGTLAGAKKLVTVRSMPPQNRTGSAYRQVIPYYNQAIQRICSKYANVIVLDTYGNLVDPTSADGVPYGYGGANYVLKDEIGTFGIDLHPSDYGGLRDGLAISKALAPRLSTVMGETYGANLITLAGAAGTLSNGTGTVTGDNPFTGWAVSVASGNATVAVQRAPNVCPNGLRISITSTTASAVTITGPNLAAGVNTSQSVRHGSKLRIANVSNITNLRSELVSGGTVRSRTIDYIASVPAQGLSCWQRSRLFALSGIGADLIPRLVINTAGTSSIQFDWMDPELFVVS